MDKAINWYLDHQFRVLAAVSWFTLAVIVVTNVIPPGGTYGIFTIVLGCINAVGFTIAAAVFERGRKRSA